MRINGRTLLAAGGATAFGATAFVSWWGARRLKSKHRRVPVAGPVSQPAQGPQRVAVILNPVKNGALTIRGEIAQALSSAGWPAAEYFETTREDPGYGQARAALEGKFDVILAAGGDGTVRAVAEVLAGTNVPMGLIPLGTGNLLARNLQLNVTDHRSFISTALFGWERDIDTAEAALRNGPDGEVSRHTFLVMAGMGLDAEVLGDTRDNLKKSIGWLAYGEAGLRHLAGRRKTVSVSLDDGSPQRRKVRSILFANCSLLPGGLDFLPEAMVDDGILDVVVLSPRSTVGWLAMYVKVLFQHRGILPVMRTYPVKKLTIWTNEPMQTQLDGDPTGLATEVSVEIKPQSLKVRVQP